MSQPMATHDLDAIVLAGGESRRMGTSRSRPVKALLPLGDTTVIGAVLATLGPLFRRVLVVSRERGDLPDLPAELLLDGRPERGPLVGLARGLESSGAPWCFVVGCDMPLLRPAVIEHMAQRLGEEQVLVPYLDGHPQLLHAFYARSCLPHAEELLGQGTTSLRALLSRCKVETVDARDFRDLDPGLHSLRDVDTEDDYQAAQKLLLKEEVPLADP